MNRLQSLNCFQLNHQAILNHDIHTITAIQLHSFVDNGQTNLPLVLQTGLLKLIA